MTQPVAPTISALARKWKFQVDTGAGAPTWTDVLGITDMKPQINPTLQDDGVYDDAGWGSKTKTGLDWTVEAKLIRRHSVANDTVYDPGQEKLRTLSELYGAAGVAHVRFFDRDGGPEAYEGYAEVDWQNDGGKRTDLEGVTVKLTGRGARTAITNPLADPPAIPTVTAVTPVSGGIAGGTQIDISGSQFVGLVAATAVKVGGTNATSYIVVSDSRIIAVTPAHAAGAVNVTVTNAAGTSTTGAANQYTYV